MHIISISDFVEVVHKFPLKKEKLIKSSRANRAESKAPQDDGKMATIIKHILNV